MNNYTRITYQDMLEDFTARLRNDERFKNMSSASIYYLFMEMLTGTFDMTNFYMQRTAEEGFIDTAKLDSSVIKHGKNLGYNPIRPTPAEAEIQVIIKGPLPAGLVKGATIYFSQEETDLSFDNRKFMLNTDYSYVLTQEDIDAGQSASWSKTLTYSVPVENMKYLEIQDVKMYNNSALVPIKIFQGEVQTHVIRGVANLYKLGKAYQFYDIDDLKFSNWYGKRDPNGWYKNTFYKKNSWTKIGIGKTEEDALYVGNLFDIEDCSIYLNEKLAQFDESTADTPYKICSLTTNSDKTVRLKFGDGTIVSPGLISDTDNIYIKYLTCDGSQANKIGSKSAEIKANNKFYATCPGGIIDVSNNIKFILNTDIQGGVDFESQQSIKNNAPLYFASNNRLVTKQDFVSYFRGLTSPIKVKNAIAWGQDEIEDFDNGGHTTYKYIQNCICYCIASTLYNTTSAVHYPINVLTDSSSNTNGTFSVYGTNREYLNHLTDFIKMLLSFDSFHNTQYTETPTVQWLKNIKKIRENAEPKMIINSKLYSFPPVVQYYDVVGTVTVNSLSKLQSYKREVENKIYEWLEENSNFRQKIYKSDIVRFFNEREETKAVDLDIRVSDIIKTKDLNYVFDMSNTPLSDIYTFNPNVPGSDMTVTGTPYNTITIPKQDRNGNILTADMLENKTIQLYLYAPSASGSSYSKRALLQVTPYSVTESRNNITMTIYGVSSYTNVGVGKNSLMYLNIPATTDFYSLSNFSTSNAKNYGLSSADVNDIQSMINTWINNSTAIREASRAIPLPYYVQVLNNNTREETILRRGIIQNDYETQLTEKAFWMYFIPSVIKKHYKSSLIDFNEEDLNGDVWTNIDNLVYDLYTQMKATFCDGVLDDNNNIVNFSMDNEIPVVRLNITYKYGN